MATIKKINKDITINAQSRQTNTCKQWPTFSLLYMTTNNNYNFNYFKASQQSERINVTANVFKKLFDISCQDWKYWYGLDKYNGIETIPFNRVFVSPQGITLTDDEKVIVFRFKGSNTKEYRILGFRRNSCPTLHIFAFDFDFTAYKHGK